MFGPQNLKFRALGSCIGPWLALYSKIDVEFRHSKPLPHSLAQLSVCLFLLLSLAGSFRPTNAGLPLSEHVRHFEPVFYDSIVLQHHHRRAKRDATHTLHLDFTAHNREFKIRLKRDTSIFADDVVFESTEGRLDFDLGKFYSGTLEDDDVVNVHGLVTKEGLFDGHIATPNELYYLEPAHRYLPSASFHSVMYKASDVVHPKPATCASQQLHLRGRVHNPWLTPPRPPDDDPHSRGPLFEPFGEPHLNQPEDHLIPPSSSTNSSKENAFGTTPHSPVHPKLKAVTLSSPLSKSKDGPSDEGGPYDQDRGVRPPQRRLSARIPGDLTNVNFESASLRPPLKDQSHRRSKSRSIIDPKKTTCMLYLQADHLFFREEGSEEACIDKITRHVQRVNNIYKVTDFDRDGKVDKIGFMIKRIKIHTENATKDPSYRFPGNYGVEKFLELFSEEDYDAFCLAYMFTYRDFEGGTLGLAWTGDLKNAGGVCEKNGHYRGSLKSLNTGIVTLLNYGKKVPPAVSHVTLAHEIGHNFGSPHDPEKDTNCTPGGENGNYIMFARATSGDKENNNKFSPCSLKQINSVLNSKARDPKGCFTEPQRAVCGNGVVEEGEECDCGWLEDCEESCCFPMVTNPPRNHRPCTLRPSKICSPSQGPCCTRDCDLKQGDLCREDNGCRDSSFCDGSSPYCPPSINKPNKTICKDEFVCFKGECTGSICLAYGLDSCQCKRESGDPETKSCELCCKLPGEDKPCRSSFEWNELPFEIPDMYAKPGTPCDDYKGYCDVFQKCREVDPSGPLATLRELLLGNESLANLHRWIVDHWYAVFFIFLALIVILVAVAKLFGRRPQRYATKRQKSRKKKKKTIVHKNGATNGHFLTPTVANSAEGTTHVVHPTVVRTSIPFKMKVNEVRRAATKAKRVARSQLGRPYKKPNLAKRTDGGVTSPTESEKSLNNVSNTKATSPSKSREKQSMSSRFSIISFKSFKPKPISPDKPKPKVYDKRKSGVPGERRAKSKSKVHQRNRSPDKKRKSIHEGQVEVPDKGRSRSPSKRMVPEEERRKSKLKPNILPDKPLRSSSPEKGRKPRPKSPDKCHKLNEGNWLINKFLADEEKIAKPVHTGSLVGSLNGSLNSINSTANPSPLNGSPIISHNRSGSTRALLATPNHAGPIRGIVNEAFIGSPRNARTHSSLKVSKSISPDEKKLNLHVQPTSYRRSISMGASYNSGTVAAACQDKRKRSTLDEGALEKRRRFSSPEKPSKPPQKSEETAAPALKERPKSSTSNATPGQVKGHRRRSASSLPSSVTSSNHSMSAVPEKIRQKLALINASPDGDFTSIVMPEGGTQDENLESAASRPCQSVPKIPPKDWV